MDKNCMTIDLKGYIREMGASVLEFAATSRLLPFSIPLRQHYSRRYRDLWSIRTLQAALN